MLTSRQLCGLWVAIALACQVVNVAAQAPAPAPGIELESDEAAAAAYPISTQQQQPLTESASLPVTCNITLIGEPVSLEPAVAVAGRRLHAATKTGGGLKMADIHCTGSYNVTIVGGPALQPFAPSWTGESRRKRFIQLTLAVWLRLKTSQLMSCSRRLHRNTRCAVWDSPCTGSEYAHGFCFQVSTTTSIMLYPKGSSTFRGSASCLKTPDLRI